jgi:hypothetical protein
MTLASPLVVLRKQQYLLNKIIEAYGADVLGHGMICSSVDPWEAEDE